MKRWFNLSHDKPWEKEEELQFGIQRRKIHPDEYMEKGWERQGEVRYVRGSRYNKVMMSMTWVYYLFIIAMVIRLIWVLNT